MFEMDYNLIPAKALKQHWAQARFSYMETPRPDYGLLLVLNGQIDFVSSQTDTLCAKVGDIVFLPKNSNYEARFRTELGEIDNYLINFESSNAFSYTKPTLISGKASFSCVNLFEQFVDENYNAEGMGLRSKGMLYLLIDSILNDKRYGLNEVAEKAMELLKKDEVIPISRIARECSVSESGLRKIFSEQLGIPPAQYRLKEKINKAKYLLEATDMPVGEISDKLNFYDAAYFCKFFHKQTGLSPKQYRQSKKL